MQQIRLVSAFSAFAAFFLIGRPLIAQKSPFDLSLINTGNQFTQSASMLAQANGALFAVGVVTPASNFQTTPGALSVASTGSATGIYIEKLSLDGSIVASALVADGLYDSIAAAVDSAGNVYIAASVQDVAGSTGWDATGNSGVFKISPQLDQVLYATHVFGYNNGSMSMSLDADGSAFVALVNYENIRTVKLDPTGSQAFSYTLTDMAITSATDPYDMHWVGVSVAPDHSYWVGASPMFLYHVNTDGNQTLDRVSLGAGNIELTAMEVDGKGNLYAAGTGTSPFPIPATPLDYSTSSTLSHTLVMKFDSTGASLFTSAFATATVTALAVDASGNLWAAGGSYAGSAITILELGSTGSGYLHYLSAPANLATVNALTLDGTGRALLAGATNSPQLPDPIPSNSNISLSQAPNAFLLRTRSSLTAAALKLVLTASPSSVCSFGSVTYQATVTNLGPAAATDVRVLLPAPTEVISCNATGQGVCEQNGHTWTVAYDSLAPGDTEAIQFALTVPETFPSASQPTPTFPAFLTALTSADDSNQLDNNADSEVPIQTTFLPIETSLEYLVLDLDNTVGHWAIGSFADRFAGNIGVPAVTGSTVSIYVATPQVDPLGGGVYAFSGWSDGSVDNPRAFTAVSSFQQVSVIMREITEPWVNPDSPLQHGSSYRTGAIAPGEVVTLFGYNLGPAVLQQAALDSTGRLATNVAGFQVTFDGAPAPVVYTSASQSSVIVPYEVSGKASVPMVITYNGLPSTPVAVAVASSVPGTFTANASGSGPLVAFNGGGSLNSRTDPIQPGGVIVLYESGEGLTTPLPADGTIAGNPAPTPRLPVSATIAGQPAQIVYAGGVPGITAGLMQLNISVPENVPAGLLPVLVTVGTGVSQQEATIAVH